MCVKNIKPCTQGYPQVGWCVGEGVGGGEGGGCSNGLVLQRERTIVKLYFTRVTTGEEERVTTGEK